MELVDGVSWVDTSGGHYSASRWTAIQMPTMMMKVNVWRLSINCRNSLWKYVHLCTYKCWKLSHQSLPPGCPDLFPQSWMHLWRFEGTISRRPDKVSHWGEITWHKGHTRLITLSLTLSDLILSLSISTFSTEALQWYTFTFGAIVILLNSKL